MCFLAALIVTFPLVMGGDLTYAAAFTGALIGFLLIYMAFFPPTRCHAVPEQDCSKCCNRRDRSQRAIALGQAATGAAGGWEVLRAEWRLRAAGKPISDIAHNLPRGSTQHGADRCWFVQTCYLGAHMIPLEAIKRNAQMVIEQSAPLSNLNFGYNAESVEWLDGYIERLRASGETFPEMADRLVQVFGSYLGECIIHCYGGEWRESEGSLGVFFDDDNAAFPFAKVEKQFNHGTESGDSISSFFRCIPVVFKRKERARPWWKFW